MRIELGDIDLIYNDHVGNEWTYDVTILYEGIEYKLDQDKGVTLTLIPGKTAAVINTYIVEDDKYPDESSKNTTVSLLKLSDLTISNYVKEGHGRYAGHTAQWNFNFHISPIKFESAESLKYVTFNF